MQFRLDPQQPIEMLTDGSYIAHVDWYEDDADPEHDTPALRDQVRLPYWHLYQDDEEREQYLLAVIAARHEELLREQQLREQSRAAVSPRIRALAGVAHRITAAGEVRLRRRVVEETVVTPEVPDAPGRHPVSGPPR